MAADGRPDAAHRGRAVPGEWVDYNGHVLDACYLARLRPGDDRAARGARAGGGGTARRRAARSTPSSATCATCASCTRATSRTSTRSSWASTTSASTRTTRSPVATAGEAAATCELLFLHVNQASGRVEPLPEEARERVAALYRRHAALPQPRRHGTGHPAPSQATRRGGDVHSDDHHDDAVTGGLSREDLLRRGLAAGLAVSGAGYSRRCRAGCAARGSRAAEEGRNAARRHRRRLGQGPARRPEDHHPPRPGPARQRLGDPGRVRPELPPVMGLAAGGPPGQAGAVDDPPQDGDRVPQRQDAERRRRHLLAAADPGQEERPRRRASCHDRPEADQEARQAHRPPAP